VLARRLRRVTTFVFRLMAPRPTFAPDMTDEEREIMGRHAAHWQPFVDGGQMVVFGPVLDSRGSWSLAVIEADDEDQLRTVAAGDPGRHDGDREDRDRKDARGIRPSAGLTARGGSPSGEPGRTGPPGIRGRGEIRVESVGYRSAFVGAGLASLDDTESSRATMRVRRVGR
jgi:uncharacterized protein